METKIQIFENGNLGMVRVIEVKGEPMFVGADAATLFGYQNTRDAIAKHVDEEDKATVAIHDGSQNRNVVVINESGFYSLVLSSKLPTAKAAKRWVTSEVLPAIRKTGGYMVAKVDETPEEIMARALLVAQDTMRRKDERIRQLEGKVESTVRENNRLRPKAELMEKVLDADERIDIGQSAKILNLPFGRNTLFQKLREMGVFFKNKNEPKQEYVRRGYFVLKEKWIDRNNHDGFMVLKVLVTQKGLEFLASLFKVVRQPKEVAEVI